MLAIMKRNLLIYLKNPTNIFFSLLGSLIVFFLYIFFLRNNMLSVVKNVTHGAAIIDGWMMGALLTVTAITTSFSTLGQLVKDKASNKFMDFAISETQPSSLLVGYFASSFTVAFLMQGLVFLISFGYFATKETISLSFGAVTALIGGMLLTALATTALNLLLIALVKSEATLVTLSSIISALSGFITGAYLPVGQLTGLAHKAIKIFPLSYSAANFRAILTKKSFSHFPSAKGNNLKNYLGIHFSWHGTVITSTLDIAILAVFTVICLLLVLMLSKKLVNVTLAGRN